MTEVGAAQRTVCQLQALQLVAQQEDGLGFAAYAAWLRAGAPATPSAQAAGWEYPESRVQLAAQALEAGRRQPPQPGAGAVYVVQGRQGLLAALRGRPAPVVAVLPGLQEYAAWLWHQRASYAGPARDYADTITVTAVGVHPEAGQRTFSHAGDVLHAATR